ncbi:helix-turn-helix domain-containing protein [Streptomyces sp. NPDC096339]|uniref:helix-turn-helix domain-containing protein n=1 Tax=Streptomyces sp. NPDC096339 TaxID=3366086 RepID=UPI00382C8F23
MGRPELPVDHAVPERGALAVALRELRSQAGLSYDDLAAGTALSAATFKRAASGRTLPTEETVKVFVSACGGNWYALRKLWLAAKIADRGRLEQLRRPALPQFVSGRRELSAALEYFYEAAGAPSLRRLSELAGGAHMLPVSTAHRIVTRRALPASGQQMTAFLAACGLTGDDLLRWEQAFKEITEGVDTDRRAARFDSLLEAVTERATWLGAAPHRAADGRDHWRPERVLRWSREDLHIARRIAEGTAVA